MDGKKRTQAYVRADDSAEDKRREEIWERSQIRATIYAQQRRIELVESQINTKSRNDADSHKVVEPSHQDLVEWTLTHGGQISAWSKQLTGSQEQLGVLDKHEKDLTCIRADFLDKILRKNLPGYLSSLAGSPGSPGNVYPDVLTSTEKQKRLEEDWENRMRVLQRAFDDHGRKRIPWARGTVAISSAVELQLGKTACLKFKKERVEMAAKRRKEKPRYCTPDSFEIIPL